VVHRNLVSGPLVVSSHANIGGIWTNAPESKQWSRNCRSLGFLEFQLAHPT
jgi:hypothetical protein